MPCHQWKGAYVPKTCVPGLGIQVGQCANLTVKKFWPAKIVYDASSGQKRKTGDIQTNNVLVISYSRFWFLNVSITMDAFFENLNLVDNLNLPAFFHCRSAKLSLTVSDFSPLPKFGVRACFVMYLFRPSWEEHTFPWTHTSAYQEVQFITLLD
jgi:hypothetical protein